MINLEKGQKVALPSTASKFKIGLGWNPNTAVGGEFDIDVSAFMLNKDNKLVSDNHFVYYNNLKSPNEALVHLGDNRTGVGEGDDETLTLDTSNLEANVESIVFVTTIHNAVENRQNFGQISGSYIRVCDENTNEELVRFDLNEDFSIETAVVFGRIYRKDGNWRFEATGTGMRGGLQDYLTQYN